MTDIVDRATRSRMMSGIRSTNTRIEVSLRKALFAQGFRYRINDARLPGKPDIVLPRHRAVVFVHGCFWHGHDCALFRLPASNTDFWRAKIDANRERDERACGELSAQGWRVAVVWECALRGRTRLADGVATGMLSGWLMDSSGFSPFVIRGTAESFFGSGYRGVNEKGLSV